MRFFINSMLMLSAEQAASTIKKKIALIRFGTVLIGLVCVVLDVV